jgi:hypothetical protein
MSEGPSNPNASRFDQTIAGVLHTLGWLGLYVGIGEPFIQYFIAGGAISSPVACVVATVLGFVFHGFAYAWPPSKPEVRAFLTRLILPVVRRGRTVAIVGFLVLWTILLFQIASVRSDLDAYAMPRQLSQQQAHDLSAYLTAHGSYPVTVKADVSNPEAWQYASQIYSAIHSSNWKAELSPVNDDPKPINQGLCIQITGAGKGPALPTEILQKAFQSAGIEGNCSGVGSAGDYKMFVLVGSRPIAIGRTPSLLTRLGQWLEEPEFRQ